MGCDYAPTEHTHENDSLPTDGYLFICGGYYNIETTYLNLNYSIDVPTPFPTQVCELTNLTRLQLHSNELTGEIPSCIGNLTNLTYLELSSNELTGEIPPEIGNLTNLTHLQLGWNQLSGEIPPEVCDLIENNNLDFNNILYSNNLINTCE